MGNILRKPKDELNLDALISVKEKRLKVVIFGDKNQNDHVYAKAKNFYSMLTDKELDTRRDRGRDVIHTYANGALDMSTMYKTPLVASIKTTQGLFDRSKYEALIGSRIRRVVSGNTIHLISSEIWLLPEEFKTINSDTYFDEETSIAFLFTTPEALDHLKTEQLKVPDSVKVIQLNPDNIESPAELDNYLDIFDACVSEFLIQKRREEKSCAASTAGPLNQNQRDTQTTTSSFNEEDEFRYIDSEEEDLNNDILTQDRKQIKKKYKNYISTMKETDERMAKSLAACEDLSNLEEKFKQALLTFLEMYDEMDDEEWEEKNRKTTRGKTISASGRGGDEDENDNGKDEGIHQVNSDIDEDGDGGGDDDDDDSIFNFKKPTLRNYTTSDFDIFMKNCLKMSNYQVNVVDGRGGVRLVPKKFKKSGKLGESGNFSGNVAFEHEINANVGFEGHGGHGAVATIANGSHNANGPTVAMPIFSEQLKEIFKIYNEQIYTAINDILTVYPEALEVMKNEIQVVKDQLEGDVIYSKSISTGKTDRKSAEIFHAVKMTLENVVKEKDHFYKVLDYIRKREQKIQVALLMNQL